MAGVRRRCVGDAHRLGGPVVTRLGANRPPDDEQEVDERNLEQHEHEDELEDHRTSLRDRASPFPGGSPDQQGIGAFVAK